MTVEFLAIIVAGFAGAGVALLIRKLTANRAPRWLLGALAGGAMLAMAIWNEYAWYPRLVEGMPEGAVIAQTLPSTSPLRPWAFVFPMIDRAYVVDARQARRHPVVSDLVIVPVFRFERWAETRDILTAFDCAGSRRADITAGTSFSDSGELLGGTWTDVPPDDPVLRAACDGG